MSLAQPRKFETHLYDVTKKKKRKETSGKLWLLVHLFRLPVFVHKIYINEKDRKHRSVSSTIWLDGAERRFSEVKRKRMEGEVEVAPAV